MAYKNYMQQAQSNRLHTWRHGIPNCRRTAPFAGGWPAAWRRSWLRCGMGVGVWASASVTIVASEETALHTAGARHPSQEVGQQAGVVFNSELLSSTAFPTPGARHPSGWVRYVRSASWYTSPSSHRQASWLNFGTFCRCCCARCSSHPAGRIPCHSAHALSLSSR